MVSMIALWPKKPRNNVFWKKNLTFNSNSDFGSNSNSNNSNFDNSKNLGFNSSKDFNIRISKSQNAKMLAVNVEMTIPSTVAITLKKSLSKFWIEIQTGS